MNRNRDDVGYCRFESARDSVRADCERGLTLVELLIVLAIIGTLSAMVIPVVVGQLEDANNQQAMSDILIMSLKINQYIMDHGVPPANLAAAGITRNRDPWGRPYEYLDVFSDGPGQPDPRKDHFLVPLNSDYDLYSKGPDGDSKAPLTAHVSRDDIVRANNGGYVGVASEY